MDKRIERFVKLTDRFKQAEADLVRATRKWDRLRMQVRRAERVLDKEFNARAKAIGGKADWRDFDDTIESSKA